MEPKPLLAYLLVATYQSMWLSLAFSVRHIESFSSDWLEDLNDLFGE